MKLFLLSFCLIALTLATVETESFTFKSFLSFQKKFEKNYENGDEMLLRFQIYKQNLDLIEEMNGNADGVRYGVNQFADLTTEEFRGMYLNYRRPEGIEAEVLVPEIAVEDVPARFDWREKGAVTPVKNQGQCGSCWAFSAVENVESVWILAGKGTNLTVELSPQQVVDCDSEDDGCDGGDTPTAYEYIIRAGGIQSESTYPYVAQDQTCAFNAKDIVATISNWKYATQNENEKTMQQNLAAWAPLSICVDAARWQFYSSGVMTPNQCGTDLDHCVMVTGYDTTSSPNYWMVRNSWTDGWGINGYIHLSMWQDTCGVAMEATTAVV